MKAVRLYPAISVLLFLGLYVFSAILYPGGSQADLNMKGFDWVNNYWCNLLNEQAMNGQSNPARPYAIGAMVLLCSGLAFFFLQFPTYFPLKKVWSVLIRVTGILSMVCAVLIFTELHDLMTTLSSLFGLVALCGVFVGLLARKAIKLFVFGCFCVAMMGVNNFIYYSGNYLYALPLIQKITFVCVLAWTVSINVSFGKAHH